MLIYEIIIYRINFLYNTIRKNLIIMHQWLMIDYNVYSMQ